MSSLRREIGKRRIPLHDHSDLNSGGKLRVSSALHGGTDTITGLIPPSSSDPSNAELNYGGGFPLDYNYGSFGTAVTIDAVFGNSQGGTLTANCTATVTAFDPGAITLAVQQDGTGNWTLAWSGVSIASGDGSPGTAASSVTFYTLVSWNSTVYLFEAGGGAGALDDLSDVTITSAAADDTLRFNGTAWVDDARNWEAVTNGEDVFVWEGSDLVHEWNA